MPCSVYPVNKGGDSVQLLLVALLGAIVGLVASGMTVWLLARPGGVVVRVFASEPFRQQLRAALLASAGVQRAIRNAVAKQASELQERRLGALLTPAVREQALRSAAESWTRVVHDPDTEHKLRGVLRDGFGRLAAIEHPVSAFVPLDPVPLANAVVRQATPLLLARVQEAMAERQNRERLYLALRQAADRFLAQQQGWKRSVGQMLISDRVVAQATDWVSTRGVETLGSMLQAPDTQARIAAGIADALQGALARPVGAWVAGLAPERVDGVVDTITERVLGVLRDPANTKRVLEFAAGRFVLIEDRRVVDLVNIPIDPWTDRALAAIQGTAPARPVGAVIREAVRPDLIRILAFAALLGGVLTALGALLLNQLG